MRQELWPGVHGAAILDEQVDWLARFAPDGTLLYANRSFCEGFNHTPEELQGASLFALLPPEDAAMFRRHLASLQPERPVVSVERRLRDRAGWLWQQWVTKAIYDDAGCLTAYQTVGRDITAQKKLAEQLKKSEARYRGIVEDQVELIRRFQPDGRLTFVNRAFCRYFGKRREELLGQPFTNLIPYEDGVTASQIIFALTPQQPVAVSEPRVLCPDGSVRWLQWVNRAFFDEQGQVLEYQSVGRDITAQKEAEVRISEAREAMARAARVATLAVIGGGIAHEINQPLNAIRVLAETVLLLREARGYLPEEEVLRSIQRISRQVDRIDEIVNHLRSFLKTSQTFAYEPCRLADVVENALSLITHQLQSRQIQVESALAADLPAVMGCAVRLEEVVLNLLLNAMQALAQQPAPRRILISGAADGDEVCLSIADNGPGVDPVVRGQMFEPFFSTKGGDSMGLGLAIVQSIVLAHNGTIAVDHPAAGGACFVVRLPANTAG